MKMRLTETTLREVDVEVEFPIYREHDVSCDSGPTMVFYTRIDADMWQVDVFLRGEDEAEISVTKLSRGLGTGDMDYLLGRGINALTEKQFMAAFERAKKLMRRAELIICQRKEDG